MFEADDGDPDLERFLLCAVGNARCALRLPHVVETLRPLGTEPVAGAPSFVAGVTVLRGEPAVVVDLAAAIGLGAESSPSRWVAVRTGSRTVAMAVDAVLGLRSARGLVLSEMPPLLTGEGSEPVAAVGAVDGELLLVLAEARFVPDSVWEAIGGREAGA